MFGLLPAVVTTLFLMNIATSSPQPAFAVTAPPGMVTGIALLEARTSDPEVTWVKWILGDWAKTTGRPFTFSLDIGQVPQERRITVVALDKQRRPLYQQETVVNRGGRGLAVTFVTPVAGQAVSGRVPVVVSVEAPAGDPVDSVRLDVDGTETELDAAQGTYKGVVEVPAGPTALVARVRTKEGREAERSVLLNTLGHVTDADVCLIEQMVGVYKKDRPVEGLTASDFNVRDDRGSCQIRNVEFVKDTRVAVGFAIDGSVSIAPSRSLLKSAASQFLDGCFRRGDVGFVSAFGPVVTEVQGWTYDRERLRTAFESIPDWEVPGTELYEAVAESIYRFQGSQGARALILLTDGFDYDGSVTEDDALQYARHSGVKIYALAVPAGHPKSEKALSEAQVPSVESDAARYTYEPPNLPGLQRLSAATGGKTYVVDKPEDLPSIFRMIESDLRAQYLVSYVANARRVNGFHPVTVKAKRGEVHTAAGFFY